MVHPRKAERRGKENCQTVMCVWLNVQLFDNHWCNQRLSFGLMHSPGALSDSFVPCYGVVVTNDSYLVDPASSHMLVSKIKPCMSKYKHLYCETANGSLNQLSFI